MPREDQVRLARIRTLILVVLIACGCLPLFGISATYAAEAPIYLKKSPGIFTHPTMFGAKLGRLVITSNEPMYNPTILVTGMGGSYNIWLNGPLRWSEQNAWTMDARIQMNMLTVAYPYGLGGSVFIRAIKDKQPLLQGWSREQVTVSPFYVDIYLLNSNDYGGTSNPGIIANLNSTGAFFKLNSPYVFESLFNPHFTVGITNSLNQGPYVFPETGTPTQGQFIPIDEIVGQGTTPVINPSSYTDGEQDEDGFWYGDDIPQPVLYNFSFQDDSVYMDLDDAYGQVLEITTVHMQVINGITGQHYKQKVTFTVDGTSNSFELKPTDEEGPGIDFNLYFGPAFVDYGIPILWDGLNPGDNERRLYIGGIDEHQVNQRVSGGYHVTIIANITNAD